MLTKLVDLVLLNGDTALGYDCLRQLVLQLLLHILDLGDHVVQGIIMRHLRLFEFFLLYL